MTDREPVLVVDHVVAGYVPDVDILHGVSLTVGPAEIVSIIGPNGAGKSTLAKTIFNLVTPREGDIIFDGQSLIDLKPSEIVQRGLCYVPQRQNVFPNLTIHENLEMGGYLLNEQLKSTIDEIYDLFPALEEKRRSKAGTLSGGQRQMLAMGRALMLNPQLIILDEPSAGLAPKLVDTVLEKVLEINERGCAILMVEQNARRALKMSDRGIVLDMGEKALEDSGEALLKDPKVIELYLGGLKQAQ